MHKRVAKHSRKNLSFGVHLCKIFSFPKSLTIINFENHIFIFLDSPGTRNVEATLVKT